MSQLYVKRDTCPTLVAGDTITVSSRVKGTNLAAPRLFILGLEPGSSFNTYTFQGPRLPSSSTGLGVNYVDLGGISSVDLSSAVANDHNTYLVRCLSGRIAVSLVSPHEARLQFRRWEYKTV